MRKDTRGFPGIHIGFNYFLTLCSLLILITACSKATFKEAKHRYDQGYYGQAADLFEQVSKKSKSKEEKQQALLFAAESYRLNNDYEKAKRLYEKVLARDPKNSRALLMHANMLKKQEKYREAMDAYDKYLEEVPGDTMAQNKRTGCELALRWTPDSSRFVVTNFREANTKLNDWAPMIASKKDNLLYFASDREDGKSKKVYPGTMNYWSDIWYIEKTGRKGKEKWGNPVFLEKASTKYNEGGLTFDSRYSGMYLTQCGGQDGKLEKCAIYEMKKVGTEWEMGEPLEFCKEDTGHSYGHPALSPDGTKMYFSSDRSDGYGGFDIWMVSYSKRSRSWGSPVNLGPTINTKNNEYFPYYNKHDDNLYFASDGWPGIGGLDMFKIKPTEDAQVWTEMENLREPLNSGGDDFGITFLENDANSGFFTSNRGDRRNNDDIYSFHINPIVITIRGIITDCATHKILPGATIILSNDKDTSHIVLKADAMGAYRTTLAEGTNYEIVSKFPEQYYFDAQPVNRTTKGIKFSTELVQDFCLENPLDKLVVLPIFYDLDKAYIRPDAARTLDTFAQTILIKYPRLLVELGSHTDCRASVAHNEDLSRRRADSAVNYLVTKWKIDAKRITAKGYAESQLINDCKCEGSDIEGFTRYYDYVDSSGKRQKLQKAIAIKDETGNVIRSYYEDYTPGEIQVINGKRVVPCDEYQHQQNRRTTIRFGLEGIGSSRIKVDQGADRNNTNTGVDSAGKKDTVPAGKPGMDLSNAIRIPFTANGANKMIGVSLNDGNSYEFAFDLVGRYTAVPKEVAAEWFTNKIINKGSFEEGEKLKVGDVKLPSSKFTVAKITIGGTEISNVQFVISDKVEVATLGKSFFRNFKTESFVDKTDLVLLPKKAPKKKP
ncbi:MAG: OmpA family protein [Bacteroidetes bacterium]|nr:OmpA family protein [Bacteroidota bacterium]